MIFLEGKACALKDAGFEVEFAASQEHQKMGLDIVSPNTLGSFENWGTGYTDYTVMPIPPSKTDKTPLAYRWMVRATDETFEALFNEFIVQFRGHAAKPDGRNSNRAATSPLTSIKESSNNHP